MTNDRSGIAAFAVAVLSPAMLVFLSAQPKDATQRSFDRVILLEETSEDSAGVSVGDLNGDGWMDIVLAKGRHTPLCNRVLLNDGKGQFTATNLGGGPDRTYSAALADIDQDGDLDIIVSNDKPDRKLVYKNDGKGRFTVSGTWGEPSWPTRYVSIDDFNGDGYPDIIAANAGASLPIPIHYPSFVLLNDGKGEFRFFVALPAESAVIIPPADFDGDGTRDLFIPHRDGGRSFVLWTDKTRAAARPWGPTPFNKRTFLGPEKMLVRVAATGDFDGDGRSDLVFYDGQAKATSVWLNSGARTFREPVRLATGDRIPFAVAIADLNKDGKPDIVVGYIEAKGSVFFNIGNGRSFIEVPWNDGKGIVYQIAFGDIDKDGWPDIVAARTEAPNGIWFNSNSR